ncbi:MAG: hypothetical protein HZC37_25420 [Burkholderiales bacterium]|nr:hypothetical protein [Burkholderiales bacterium]
MQAIPLLRSTAPLQRVGRIEDLEFLVKESEVITGRSRRRFVIASADRLHYLVHWRSPALVVERIDDNGLVCDRQLLLPWEFEHHPLAEAMNSQQLFATAVGPEPGEGANHARS